MKGKTLLFLFIVLLAVGIGAGAGAGEVKVVLAVELLERGEYTRVISMEKYYKYGHDYEEFQKLLKEAATLQYMAEQGWSIVHVSRHPSDYHVIILER